MKNECEIVKDLIPNYMENVVSISTKEFLEEHIKNCSKCKKILEDLKKEKIKQNKNEEFEEENKIDYLKKYNKKIIILKLVAIFIIIFIISFLGVIFYKYNICKKHYKDINEILNVTYEKTLKLPEEKKNFSIIFDYGLDKREFYYKDGKFKDINKLYDENNNDIGYAEYGIEISSNIKGIQINRHYNKNKEIEESISTINEINVNKEISHTSAIQKSLLLDKFYNMGIVESYNNLQLREDYNDGIECYVIRNKINDNSYEELWIDKKEKYIVQEIDTSRNIKYNWAVGKVKDEDVKIQNIKEKPFNSEAADMQYKEIIDLLLK